MKWSRVLTVCNSGSFLCHNKVMGGGDRRKAKVTASEGRPLFTLITKAFPIPRSRPTDSNSAPEGNMRHAEKEEEEDGTRNQLVTLSGCLIVEFLLQWESVRRQKKGRGRKHRVCHLEEYNEASTKVLSYSTSSPCRTESERTRGWHCGWEAV